MRKLREFGSCVDPRWYAVFAAVVVAVVCYVLWAQIEERHASFDQVVDYMARLEDLSGEKITDVSINGVTLSATQFIVGEMPCLLLAGALSVALSCDWDWQHNKRISEHIAQEEQALKKLIPRKIEK